jgi:hypothetical protein
MDERSQQNIAKMFKVIPKTFWVPLKMTLVGGVELGDEWESRSEEKERWGDWVGTTVYMGSQGAKPSCSSYHSGHSQWLPLRFEDPPICLIHLPQHLLAHQIRFPSSKADCA